jgi:hypothetical protein
VSCHASLFHALGILGNLQGLNHIFDVAIHKSWQIINRHSNAVIGSGNQTAEIRIAPGLYDPASIWQCNVLLRSFNADLTAPIWASNSVGSSFGVTPVVANNYFDGT